MAAVKDQLKAELKVAMKNRDTARLTVLRAVLAAITNEEVSGSAAHELTDQQEMQVLTKQVRQRRESAAEYEKAGRQDLADTETAEAEMLQAYLPAPLTEDEVKALVDAEIAALDEPPTMKQMGQLVQAVNAKAAGRAEGKLVASLVRAAINS